MVHFVPGQEKNRFGLNIGIQSTGGKNDCNLTRVSKKAINGHITAIIQGIIIVR